MTHRAEHERLAITRIASILLAALAAAIAIAPGRADAAPDQTVSAAASSLHFVGAAAGPDRRGWWEVTSDGRVMAFGAAEWFGDLAGLRLNQGVVGMASSATGGGYWLVASDGGIFAFGDAPFFGSTGNLVLNKPVVTMAPTPSGNGYWLVASDGGVFTFGDATFFGSTGDLNLNKPINGITTYADIGYRMVASDGGIFAFGEAPFYGSLGGSPPSTPVVGMAPTRSTSPGYWMVTGSGDVYSFGAGFLTSAQLPPGQDKVSKPGSAPAVAIVPTCNGPVISPTACPAFGNEEAARVVYANGSSARVSTANANDSSDLATGPVDVPTVFELGRSLVPVPMPPIPLGATTPAVVPALSDPLIKYQASYRFGRADGPPFPARSVEGTRAAWAIAGWRNGATGPEVIGGPTTMWRACQGGSVATFKWTAGVFLITVSLAAGCPI